MYFDYEERVGTEKGYPRQSTVDKDGEYSFLFTECKICGTQ